MISTLPDDVLNVILEFVPMRTMVFVNKHYYILYHHCIKQNVLLYESYVRYMTKYDYSFVFERILGENMDAWIRNRNYRYKNTIFNNYIYFMLYYFNEHKSKNCRDILMKEFEKRDLCRNLHKKNVVKYINGKYTH